MAETAVSFVLQQSLPFVVEEGRSLTGFGRDIKEISNELESVQALLKDADTKAAEEGGEVKAWTKQLREESFRIEDVIDYYNMNVAQRVNHHSGLIALLQNIFHIPTLKSLYHVTSEIRDIKSSVAGIKRRSTDFDFQSERRTKAARFADPEIAPYFNEEVVGFKSPRDELVRFLVGRTSEPMLVSVVGMGGLGKTTLAKYVFNKQEVENSFNCRFYFLASQFNTADELLIDMIKKLCENSNEPIPEGLEKMGQITLTTHVREHLQSKRYLMWFDDVRKEDFADGIVHALIKNDLGSRIIVTTRMMHVAEYFKKDFLVHIHNLQPLPQKEAWKLFCIKTFRGQCPEHLEKMSKDIVQKCGGLPLAIVVIGEILSTKAKLIPEWRKVSQNLMELDGNVHFTRLTMSLSRSYDDLPCHLKLCMLYFGIYPEHCTINCKRLTRQWIAEGFVTCDEGKTLEEVAEEYLKELIQTSLVQASSVGFNGRVKSCKVHDLLRHIITRKMRDLSFCHIMHEDREQVIVGITRRFSIATFSNVLRNNSNSRIRAIFVFDNRKFPEYFIDSLSVKFKFVKVLDFENSLLNYVPENLGNLLNLKYLNLSHTKVTVLPRSIGNLLNLETLDLRQTQVVEIPIEIKKLTKLRILSVCHKNYEGHSMFNFTTGAQMQKGIIGCLKSLQNLYFLEAGCGGVDLIQELNELSQLRKLGIRGVRGTYGNALCTAVQEMTNLESLNITAITEDEILDLHFVSAPPCISALTLKAKLTMFPDWIPRLEYIVKLVLGFCEFEHDPLDSLQNLPNLMRLILRDNAFAGESLHFQEGGFPMLKELDLTRLKGLSSVSIDRDALLCLKHFRFYKLPKMKVLPQDLQNLENLQFLGFADMPIALVNSIDREKGGGYHWIINHIPRVLVCHQVGSNVDEYKWRRIPTQL